MHPTLKARPFADVCNVTPPNAFRASNGKVPAPPQADSKQSASGTYFNSRIGGQSTILDRSVKRSSRDFEIALR
jgi:hypothetical protein